MLQIRHILPAVYQKLISSQILHTNATETKATCDNCLRARDHRFSYTYQSDLKCCTFHPYLSNYAVGALLQQSERTPGILTIENKIANREFAFPIGVMVPFDYQFSFLNKEENEFGNRRDLLCPYYDTTQNQCSIWRYRGVVCTSFYCRSDYGQDGLKFWAVFSDYLSYVEMALAEECLIQLDFSPRDLSDQLEYLNKREFDADEVNQRNLSESVDSSLWNAYHDKVGFYKKCFSIVENIDRKKFREIIGNQGLDLEKEVLDYANRR